MMRVHLIGNTCNNHYVLTKFLREAGVDAHLFYDTYAGAQSQPERDDSSLSQNRPSWLHPYQRLSEDPRGCSGPPYAIRDRLFQCDLMHVQGSYGMIWALESGKPFVWYPYGDDLYADPFIDVHASFRQVSVADPAWLLVPALVREAITRVSAININWWGNSWEQGIELIDHLGAKGRIVHIPVTIDHELFTPGDDVRITDLIDDCAVSEEHLQFTIFHPTRLMFSSREGAHRFANDDFGNDKLITALGRLKREGMSFALVLVRSEGSDLDEAEQLIQMHHLSDRVIWIPRQERHELINWYRAADLTVDKLGAGAFGSIGIEAMACGCPLMVEFLTCSDAPSFWEPPDVPPIINVHDEASIEEALRHYMTSKEELLRLGAASRKWIEQFAAGDVVAERFRGLYERVVGMLLQNTGLPDDITCCLNELFDPEAVAAAARVISPSDEDAPSVVAAHYAQQFERARMAASSRPHSSFRQRAAQLFVRSRHFIQGLLHRQAEETR